MKRASSLKRKTPLRATKPMRKVSDKQKAANVLYRKALKEWRAQHDGRCYVLFSGTDGLPVHRDAPAKGAQWVRCGNAADEAPHHMRGRRGSLLYDIAYMLPVCRSHHDWIHQHANRARELGWLEF